MKMKSFECLECGYTTHTDDYWYQTDFTDNGPEELAFAECFYCKETVEED
jgi:hypothetical protein